MNITLSRLNMGIADNMIIKRHGNQKKIKRCLDIVIALPITLIALPIIFISCIAIRIESKGSPIYKQKRAGFRGTEFVVYKLRTMYDRSSEGNLSAPKPGDSRVTKVGKFLRMTSIDELPQFINVIKGEMSILGPRAIPEKEIELRIENMMKNDSSKTEDYKRAMQIRRLMKPGISGMAQAYGRSSLTTEEATAYDIYYVLEYSLFLDVKIFFKTIDTILFRKGVN